MLHESLNKKQLKEHLYEGFEYYLFDETKKYTKNNIGIRLIGTNPRIEHYPTGLIRQYSSGEFYFQNYKRKRGLIAHPCLERTAFLSLYKGFGFDDPLRVLSTFHKHDERIELVYDNKYKFHHYSKIDFYYSHPLIKNKFHHYFKIADKIYEDEYIFNKTYNIIVEDDRDYRRQYAENHSKGVMGF